MASATSIQFQSPPPPPPPQQLQDFNDQADESKSAFQKGFEQAFKVVSDGVGKFKKRAKAERLFDDDDEYANDDNNNNDANDSAKKAALFKHATAADGAQHQTSRLERLMEPSCGCLDSVLSKRFQISLLSSIGFLISFGIRCNLGVAIIKMTRPTKTENNQILAEPEFDWTPETVGVVDSSFFWGYIVTQIPGGFLAARFPANRVFGSAIATSAFLNMLLPIAAKAGFEYVMVLRIVQGLVEGVTYPACHGIWRHWAPPMERSRLATLAFCGSYAGAVVGLPMSSVLTSRFGWQAPFYFYGAVGLIWYAFWLWLSFEKPSKHPSISREEKEYIESCIGTVSHKPPTFASTPWRAILTSPAVWAINVANFCRSWTFYLLLISQPMYFSEVFNFEIEEAGILGSLPHLCMALIVPFGGQLADHLRTTQILTTTQVRKLFNCGGFGMEALFLLIVGMTQDTKTAIFSLTLAVGFSGFAISGFNVNHLDIAPRYASILMGISNGVGTLAGMLCPVVVQEITIDKKNYKQLSHEWNEVFQMAGSIHIAGVIFYYFFASGELQPWAEPPEIKETNNTDCIGQQGDAANTNQQRAETELTMKKDIEANKTSVNNNTTTAAVISRTLSTTKS